MADCRERVSYKDYFLLGVVAGLFYSMWKSPGSCACGLGCVLLIAGLLFVGLAVFLWEHGWVAILIIVGWLLVRHFRQPAARERAAEWSRRRRDRMIEWWQRRDP